MKKTLSLLLLLFLLLTMAAYAEETVSQPDTIQITLDNWTDYFEIVEYLEVDYPSNDFSEPTGDPFVRFVVAFALKEAYAADYRLTSAAFAYDADYTFKDITFNLDDLSFEIKDCVSLPDMSIDESLFVRGQTERPSQWRVNRYTIADGLVVEDYLTYYGEAIAGKSNCMAQHCCCIVDIQDGTGRIEEYPTNIQITRIEGTLKKS